MYKNRILELNEANMSFEKQQSIRFNPSVYIYVYIPYPN